MLLSTRGALAAPPPCDDPGTGWCLARRFAGAVPDGEMGFRFGEPLDLDGDGRADVAAGTRFQLAGPTHQNGSAAVWSGATGALLRSWDGDLPDALFGHWVLPVADLDGDGRADLVVSAPLARVDGRLRGVLTARSPASGATLWTRAGEQVENFGCHLEPTDDRDGDGHRDLWVGAPSLDGGRVYLVSARTGETLRILDPAIRSRSFGWYVASLCDLDGDGTAEVAVGAPFEQDDDGTNVGGVHVIASRTGGDRFHRQGIGALTGFGEVVTSVGDVDGDGAGELVVASPGTNDPTRSRPGEVRVFSGATGRKIRRWPGRQSGELFGRMVVSAGDLDGDGVDDLAVGAPWYRRDADDRTGRMEIRSGRTGAILSELIGDAADAWFGWHIRRAPDPAGRGRPAFLIASLRHPVDGHPGVGVIDLVVWRGR